jgi:catalase-peroxidase
LIDQLDTIDLKARIRRSGLSVGELISTAWASASTYRGSDRRGGSNGARVALLPQRDWEVNQPIQLAKVLDVLRDIKAEFHRTAPHGSTVSLADLIVLAGAVGVEAAALSAGCTVQVPFCPGRTDATQAQTDIASFAVLKPQSDGFRNYQASADSVNPEHGLLDKAQALTLSAPEMTVLIGGMRVVGGNFDNSAQGVWTQRPGQLTNDFFVNLLDGRTVWKPSATSPVLYEGLDRVSGHPKWVGTRVDLTFGSHAQLRALAEVYAQADGHSRFVKDFVAAWSKVMGLGFDHQAAKAVHG